MCDLSLPHVLQPLIELLLRSLLSAIVIRWRLSLLQPDVVMGVHVANLSSTHPGMSTNSLEYTTLSYKGFSWKGRVIMNGLLRLLCIS